MEGKPRSGAQRKQEWLRAKSQSAPKLEVTRKRLKVPSKRPQRSCLRFTGISKTVTKRVTFTQVTMDGKMILESDVSSSSPQSSLEAPQAKPQAVSPVRCEAAAPMKVISPRSVDGYKFDTELCDFVRCTPYEE